MSSNNDASASSEKSKPFTSRFLLTDDQIRELGIEEHRIEWYRRRHYQNSFAIDKWLCPEVESFTFKTLDLPLSFKEASAMVSCNRVWALASSSVVLKKRELTEEEVCILHLLEERIDKTLKENEMFVDGAFVKLNTRSPKDVPWREYNDEKYQSE